MEYKIRFVDADVLPAGHDWAICRMGERTIFAISRDMCTAPEDEITAMLEEAWSGYRELVTVDQMSSATASL